MTDLAEPKTISVVILGDKMTLVRAMRDHLRSAGFRKVEISGQIEEALSKLHQHKADVLVIDLDVEAEASYKAIAAIRNDDHFFRLPIIALTGNASKDTVMKAVRVGVNDVMTKPFPLKQLHDRILLSISRGD